jgi:hypothetical protein
MANLPDTSVARKYNPRNINYMPVVKFSARLDLEQIIRFVDGHYIVPIHKWTGTTILGLGCQDHLPRLDFS